MQRVLFYDATRTCACDEKNKNARALEKIGTAATNVADLRAGWYNAHSCFREMPEWRASAKYGACEATASAVQGEVGSGLGELAHCHGAKLGCL